MGNLDHVSSLEQETDIRLLLRKIKDLETENNTMSGQLRKAEKSAKWEVLHYIQEWAEEDDSCTLSTYLSQPTWDIQEDGTPDLIASFPVRDVDEYARLNGIDFYIYKMYSVYNCPPVLDDALHKQDSLPECKPFNEGIRLCSKNAEHAAQAFFKASKDSERLFPGITNAIGFGAPYIWWYHYRKQAAPPAGLERGGMLYLRPLLGFIEGNYGAEYDDAVA